MPQNLLLRKIEIVVGWEHIYKMAEHFFSDGPVVLVKRAFVQHLYGIQSLHQMAYRWFLHYNLDTPFPHFATGNMRLPHGFPKRCLKKYLREY